MIEPKIKLTIDCVALVDNKETQYLHSTLTLNDKDGIKSGGITNSERNPAICREKKKECRQDLADFTAFVQKIEDAIEEYAAKGKATELFKPYKGE
ncbi:hypothetical protein [Eubacterium limosum]|uniref:hypothetical protein n=1 Tax=Eubacterium limosum TaxID=1736 RepID=UPI00106306B9|nr:hypothetical protein [Eubacterium limosum]